MTAGSNTVLTTTKNKSFMKYRSKISCSVPNSLGGFNHILIKGKIYVCDPEPTSFNTKTLEASPPSYIVSCEDGKWRKYYAEHFMDIVEWREEKLNELGI